MRAVTFAAVVVCLFFCSLMLDAHAAEDLIVEGILYDDANGDNSVAVVNGQFLRKGDTYEGHTVLSVEANAVRLKDQVTGKESQVHIRGGNAPQAPLRGVEPGRGSSEKPKTIEASEFPDPSRPSASPVTSLQKIMNEFSRLISPSAKESAKKPGFVDRMIGLAWEITAIVELRNLYVAASAYYLMKGGHAREPSDLVAAKLVSKEFEDGVKGKYRFSIKSSGGRVELRANPLEEDSGLKYYYIDEDGTIRVASKGPANAESPAITPANVMGWSE